MKFLTTKKIAAGIEDVIKESNDFITLVSPYIKLSQEYLEWLHEAAETGVKVLIICGKKRTVT